MDHYKCTVESGRLIIQKKVYSYGDTNIFIGLYYGKNCIIKRINISKSLGVNSKTLREISFLKKNQHPNIVKLYGVLCDDEYIYVVLEQGKEDASNMSREDIIKYNMLDDIMLALTYMENNGYIHGDLTFRNIVMFEKFGQKSFKLIDFGSATKSYRISAVKSPTCYISPIEILECHKTNTKISENDNVLPEKIDSWAFGCLTYYVNTGNIVTNKDIYNIIEEINYSNEDVKFLLSSDVNNRYTIGEYYGAIYINDDSNQKLNQCNISSVGSGEIFRQFKKSDYVVKKNEILCDFLMLDILNNIPVENIFMTFNLIHQTNYKTEDEYIINCFVLFYITTKLVCTKEFNNLDFMCLLNKKISKSIKSVSYFNEIVINTLFLLDWDIDVETQISFITSLEREIRVKYIIISLAILCDNKLSIFSNHFLHQMIILLLELENGNIDVISKYENSYLATHVIKLIIESINKLNCESTNPLNDLTNAYFKNLGCPDYLDTFKHMKI